MTPTNMSIEFVSLWEGIIINHNDALQLVLIVDYIIDWARDIYRSSIMRQLMSVADKGSQSTHTIVEEPGISHCPDTLALGLTRDIVVPLLELNPLSRFQAESSMP
jgi:hypothetical protein